MLKGECRFQLRPHSNNFAVVLVSEFTALCTNPKGPPLVYRAWLGRRCFGLGMGDRRLAASVFFKCLEVRRVGGRHLAGV